MTKLAAGFAGALLSVSVLSCSNDESNDSGGEPAGVDGGGGSGGGGAAADGPSASPLSWPTLECDSLVPSYCPFPFPSNVFTEPDEGSETGLVVRLSDAMMPEHSAGGKGLTSPWNGSDGFSPTAALMAHFPQATGDGLVGPNDIADSLADGSLTIVIDAETGERIPHFSELDRTGTVDAERTLLIRPVLRLEDARRYLVAIRGLTDASAAVIAPTEPFLALRDDLPSDDESVEARRALYDDIFSRLEDAGVSREDLQLAWDFTTASKDEITGRLVHMRDEAFSLVPSTGPEYTIASTQTVANGIELEILMRTPLYMGSPGPASNVVLGPDGLPEPNPDQPFVDVPVLAFIPDSAQNEPAKLMQYGHGLLGTRSQVTSGNRTVFANDFNYIVFGVDMQGMAEEDLLPIIGVLQSPDLHRYSEMMDRLHQGMLNSLLAMRMMSTSFSADPQYGSMVDPERRYYHGISQGGIFGGTYMAVTTDVELGVLGVPGQPYNLLLNRSVDFDPFFLYLRESYPSALDQQFGLVLVQMLWDRTEPGGYTRYLERDLLPGTPPHRVLMRAALGDHQVTTLGAHHMARSIGAKHVDSGIRDIFGLDKVGSLTEGSGLIEYEFGLPPDPECNLPQGLCEDPHGEIRPLNEAIQQMHLFFTTGEIRNFCANDTCSFDVGLCVGGESNAGLCE